MVVYIKSDLEFILERNGQPPLLFDLAPRRSRTGPQPLAIFRMIGPQELFSQMHERARDLDEPLEKRAVRVVRAQPELFEHVVRFVVFRTIEAHEKSRVVRVEVEVWRGAESVDVGGNAVAFFHRVEGAANLSIQVWCKTRSE